MGRKSIWLLAFSLVFLLAVANVHAQSLPSQSYLIDYQPLNNTINDYSNAGVVTVASGSGSYVSNCLYGNVCFKPTSDLNDSINQVVKNYSISFWIEPTDASTTQSIFEFFPPGIGYQNLYAYNSGNQWKFYDAFHSFGEVVLNQGPGSAMFLTVACSTAAGGNETVYENGTQIFTNNSKEFCYSMTNPLLHFFKQGGSFQYNGEVAQISVYNISINSTQALALYNNNGNPLTGLVNNISVFINSPTNTSYLAFNYTTNYSFVSPSFASANCTSYYNGTLWNSKILANNTFSSDQFYDFNEGNVTGLEENYSVTCFNGTTSNSNTSYFNNNVFNYSYSITPASSVYETQVENIVFTVTGAVAPQAVLKPSLLWMNFNNSGVCFGSPNCNTADSVNSQYTGGQWVFVDNWTASIPLQQINNSLLTNNNWFVDVASQINSSTGQNFNVYNASPFNQSVYWGYFPSNGLQLPGAALVGSVLAPNLTVTDFVGASTLVSWWNATYGNGTVILGNTANYGYLQNGYYKNFSQSIVVPSIINSSNLINVTGWVQVIYGSQMFNRTSLVWGNQSVVINNVVFTNCSPASLSQTPFINMSLYDEQTLKPVSNGTLQISNSYLAPGSNIVQYSTFNLSTGVVYNNVTVCAFPSYLTINDTAVITYSANGYAQRNYVFTAQISNVTSQFNLYVLNLSYATLVYFNVQNYNANPVQGVQVQIQEYYPTLNSYITIAGFVSDYLGRGQVYLDVPNIQYEYTLLQNGVVVNVIGPAAIYCPTGQQCPPLPYTVVLQLQPSQPPFFYLNNGQFAANCVFNNATSNLLCTVADTQGVTDSWNLLVNQQSLLSNPNVCNINASTSSGTLVCNLGNFTGSTFNYVVSVNQNYGYVVVNSGQLNFAGNSGFGWGPDGLILTLIIMAALFFLLIPIGSEIAIGASTIGLVFSVMLGMISVSVPILVGIVVVVAFTLYILR